MPKKKHNIIYIILFIIVVVLAGICASTSVSNRKLDKQVTKLTTENAELTRRIGEVANESDSLVKKLQESTTEIARLNGELSNFADQFSDIRQGIQDTGAGISGVLEEMQQYIKDEK